jgi:hypothetical protein
MGAELLFEDAVAVGGDARGRMRVESKIVNTVEPLITDTAGEFKFCPL